MTNTLEFYPGSPALVADLTREQDRHTVFELHPQEHQLLTAQEPGQTGYVIYGDGLQGILQQLPPKTPRLLALIDPAYENKRRIRCGGDHSEQNHAALSSCCRISLVSVIAGSSPRRTFCNDWRRNYKTTDITK